MDSKWYLQLPLLPSNIVVECNYGRGSVIERRGSVMVSTFACHAADPGSIPGPGMCHY